MEIIVTYLKPYFRKMSGGLSIKFLGTIMDLLLPWILAHMIDYVVPQKHIPLILLWGGAMIVCSVLALVTNVIANRMASAVARDCTRKMRHDLFAKISFLSCAQTDKLTLPSLIARLSSDTYNIHRMVSSMQRIGVRAPILLLGGILITLTLEPRLTLILLALLPFTVLVIVLVFRKGLPLYTKLQEAIDRMVRVVRENASGIRIIKALSKGDYERRRFAEANGELTDNELRANIIMGITNPAMFLLLNWGLVAVILAGAYRVHQGLTPPGVILAFLTYFTIILNATLSITRMFVMVSRGSASGNRIAEVLAFEEDLKLGERDHKDNGFHISFENVSFSYNTDAERAPLIEGITFTLKKGETLGILGETGCGKSTLLQLLLRFYDPVSGCIRISGDDIRGIAPEELYTKFGVCFQKDVLFADTVRENVSFGRDLSAEELNRSLRFAQAQSFVDELPNGADYNLSSRGVNLSGGQRQRLLIARALAPPLPGTPAETEGRSSPPGTPAETEGRGSPPGTPAETEGRGSPPEILILDDASSALDYRTDAEFRKSLKENFENTTTIIVAQRISSVMHADHIMVLEQGRILGYGTHAELLQSCELYQEISWSQMGRRPAGA